MYPCIACSKEVTGRQQAVDCDWCRRWQHRTCGTGKMTSPDIVKTPWRTTVNWSNLYEELPALLGQVEHYEPLDDFLTGEVSFPHVNILLFGGVGAGKSSVFNTWNSVFRRKIFNVARSGSADHSLTSKISEVLGISRNSIYPMKNYESETENDASVDIMALLTLKGILNQCDAYLSNHLDTINSSYKVGEKQKKAIFNPK